MLYILKVLFLFSNKSKLNNIMTLQQIRYDVCHKLEVNIKKIKQVFDSQLHQSPRCTKSNKALL